MGISDKLHDQLSAYLEGDLNPKAQREFERLLEESPETQVKLQRMRLLRERLQALPRISASPDFDYRLQQRLQQGKAHTSPGYPRQYFQNWKVPAVGLAFIALVAVSSFMLVDTQPNDMRLNIPNESSLTPNISSPPPASPQEPVATPPETKVATTEDDSTDQQLKKNLKENLKYVNEKK